MGRPWAFSIEVIRNEELDWPNVVPHDHHNWSLVPTISGAGVEALAGLDRQIMTA